MNGIFHGTTHRTELSDMDGVDWSAGMILMLIGWGLLAVALAAIFICRRPDVSIASLLLAGSYLLTLPERYVTTRSAKRIRFIVVSGLGMFGIGAIVMFLGG